MKELIQAVSEANVDEFDYENDDFSIRIAKNEAKVVTAEAIPAPAAAPAAPAHTAGRPAAPQMPAPSAAAALCAGSQRPRS